MKNKIILLFTFFFLGLALLSSQEQAKASPILPDDFPPITISNVDNPAPGYYFIGCNSGKSGTGTYANFIMILNNEGVPEAYMKIGSGSKLPRSFQQVSNGFLTFTQETTKGQLGFILDENMNKLDSFPGYNSGRVDILPNGHYLLTEKENMPMDLSTLFKGGEPNGTFGGNIVYELDKDKNIVFIWRTTDYYPVNMSYADSLGAKYDFCHTNMIYQDNDFNFLISQRNFSSITKVNRNTGEILWKLGGKQNEFQFINENENNAPNYFSYQHHVRRLPNGNLSFFDNGVQHKPAYSRGAEYEIDEVNKTAKLVWEYRQTPDVAAKAEGSVEMLPNGNRIIGWGEGSSNGSPILTELHPDNSIACTISLPVGFKSMMASKYAWKSDIPESKEEIDAIKDTETTLKTEEHNCVKVKIISVGMTNEMPKLTFEKYNFASKYPEFVDNIAPYATQSRFVAIKSLDVDVNAEYRLNIDCFKIKYKPEEYKVYYRKNIGNGVYEVINSTYEPNSKEIVFQTNKFGEFIVAYPTIDSKPGRPNLIAPANKEKVNQTRAVTFSWSPKGYFTDTKLMIAKDENFNEVVLDTFVKNIKFSYSKLQAGETYFWKIHSINTSNIGAWSEVREFTMSEQFIEMTVPNSGERWNVKPDKYIIRWNKNITDLVRLELIKNNEVVMKIKDSLNCPTGAVYWEIPNTIPTDSIYKIRVTSVSNPQLSDESDDLFTIINSTISVEEKNNSNLISLTPSPARDRIKINIDNSIYSDVFNKSVTIYDKLGNEVISSYSIKNREVNINIENLVSGTYYLKIGAFSKAFVVVK